MGVSDRALLLAPIALAAAAIVYLSFGAWVDINLNILCILGNCGGDIQGTRSHQIASFVSDGHLTAITGFSVLALATTALLYPEWSRILLRLTTGAGLLAMEVAARVAFDTLQHRTLQDRTVYGLPGYNYDYDSPATGLYALIGLGAAVAILSVAALVMQPRNEDLTEYEEWA